MGREAQRLVGLGVGPEKSVQLEREAATVQQLTSVAANVTAAGTVITDATQLTAISNRVGTTAASTGVRLPRNVEVGGSVEVSNCGANTLNVFPAETTDFIQTASVGAAVTLATGISGTYRRVSSTRWIAI
jgi:hypothetical protein